MPNKPQLIQYGITAVVVLLVLFLRTRRLRQERPLKLEQLWIVPALYGLIAAFMFWKLPPHGLGWLWVSFGLLAGGAVGWWRGTQMLIRIDPETHQLNQKGSAAAVFAIVAVIALRVGLRSAAESGMIHMDLASATDALVASALALFSMTRLEMYLRAKRLLAELRPAG